jgi:hypothetical protein
MPWNMFCMSDIRSLHAGLSCELLGLVWNWPLQSILGPFILSDSTLRHLQNGIDRNTIVPGRKRKRRIRMIQSRPDWKLHFSGSAKSDDPGRWPGLRAIMIWSRRLMVCRISLSGCSIFRQWTLSYTQTKCSDVKSQKFRPGGHEYQSIMSVSDDTLFINRTDICRDSCPTETRARP